MSVLIDSNIIIDALRGLEPAGRYLAGLINNGGLRASVVTRAEIRSGVGGASSKAERLLSRIAWEPVGVDIADGAGAFAREFGPRFPGIGIVDYLIAATAEALGLDLATRNVKHFPMFPDLVAPY